MKTRRNVQGSRRKRDVGADREQTHSDKWKEWADTVH